MRYQVIRQFIESETESLPTRSRTTTDLNKSLNRRRPGVYESTLTMLRFSLNRAASGAGSKEMVSEWTGRRGR
jgi:hypothetical protein